MQRMMDSDLLDQVAKSTSPQREYLAVSFLLIFEDHPFEHIFQH